MHWRSRCGRGERLVRNLGSQVGAALLGLAAILALTGLCVVIFALWLGGYLGI